MIWKHKLRAMSRDPQFLWKMVLGILAVGMLVGSVVESSLSGKLDYKQRKANHIEYVETLQELAKRGDWLDVWRGIPRSMAYRFQYTGPLILAVITGLCWLAFLLQSLQVKRWTDPKLWLAVAAIPLGVLSIWITHFLIYWQEFGWGLKESNSLFGGLRFFILGVGFREELAKALCVLPLMPFLLRLRSELVALLVSACVGIGFALTENIQYFFSTKDMSVVGRFITANPFHMTLTGLIGLAIYRGMRSPRDWGPHVLATFGMMVFAHGLYDAFIVVPVLREYSIAGVIIFALVVYQFFHELRELRPRGGDTVSLTADFLCGISLVVAATFIYLCAVSSRNAALTALATDTLSAGVMVYLFLREMPETMIDI